MKGLRSVLTGVLAAVLLSVVPAKAISVIDFGTGEAGIGGSISFDGANYTGLQIPIGVINVAVNGDESMYVVDGFLNFDTALNTITITGSIDDLEIGLAAPALLLSGSFDKFVDLCASPAWIFFQASGPDVKSPELLDSLGIPLDTEFQFFGFSIAGRLTGGTDYRVTSTDIVNTSVPEPGTLLLLGSGLLGIGLVRRKIGPRA